MIDQLKRMAAANLKCAWIGQKSVLGSPGRCAVVEMHIPN